MNRNDFFKRLAQQLYPVAQVGLARTPERATRLKAGLEQLLSTLVLT